MKQTTLGRIKDNQMFWLSKRKGAVGYTMIKKDRNGCTYTSANSNRSFTKSKLTICFI
jgi:hypothetical protein